MRKTLIFISLLFTSLPLCHAGNQGQKGSLRFRYGVEWGYTISISNSYHYDYIHPEDGFRVDRKDTDFYAYSNAYANLNTGVEFLRHFGASLHAGFAGIKQERRMVPVSIRESFFFNGYDSDGVLAFIEEGLGIHGSEDRLSYFAKMGAAYRIALGARESLDLGLSFQAVTDHPPVYDNDTNDYVPDEYLRMTDALYGSINLSVSIHF